MRDSGVTKPSFETRILDELQIDDEDSFRHVALYADLKQILTRAKYKFLVLPESSAGRWDRALFLNLTLWGAQGQGDVLVDARLDPDVVAHVAWHHLAAAALCPAGTPSADALFLGEAIASAFDVYLVGRLLGQAPDSPFLETQIPAISDAAMAAGMSSDDFETLLQGIAVDPERAFEDLRALLFDATTKLVSCRGADEALALFAELDSRRFGPLLHHYELSNWVLTARAGGDSALRPDDRVRTFDRSLRDAKVSLDLLTSTWVAPALLGAAAHVSK